MNAFQRKITLRVVGVHAAIIFLMIVIPAIKGCFKPRPKEIVTFIEFGAAPATVNLQPVAKMAEPDADLEYWQFIIDFYEENPEPKNREL